MSNDKKTPAARRPYIVIDAKGEQRLVNASTPGQAVAHVYSTEVRTASAIEAARLCTDGVKIEEA